VLYGYVNEVVYLHFLQNELSELLNEVELLKKEVVAAGQYVTLSYYNGMLTEIFYKRCIRRYGHLIDFS